MNGRLAAIGAVLVFLAVACADQEPAAEPSPAPEDGSTIGVKLQEWSVVPDESSAPAGEVTFEVSNVGEDDHEFMVVRTDLDLTELPTKDDDSFDEEGEGVEVIDATNAPAHGGGEEHETVEAGDEKDFAYELDGGKYVLMCNLVEEEEENGETKTEVHFKLGMRIPFTVE